MNKGGLGVLEASRAVSCQTEVRVLINGTGDQAGDIGCLFLVVAKDVRERRGKGSRTLDAGEMNLANV